MSSPKTIRTADATTTYLNVLATGLGHDALVKRVKAELAANAATIEDADAQGNDRHKTDPSAFLGLDPVATNAFLADVTAKHDKALAATSSDA